MFMKLSFLAATSISLAALVSSCKSSNPQASSELQASRNSKWLDVTTTDGTTPSTCAETPANCTMQDPISKLKWSNFYKVSEVQGRLTWSGAITYCNDLNYNGQTAGSWRLPTREELLKAYEHEIISAASDNWMTLVDMQNYFWSASSYSYDADNAWIVHLGVGGTDYDVKANALAVVCVR